MSFNIEEHFSKFQHFMDCYSEVSKHRIELLNMTKILSEELDTTRATQEILSNKIHYVSQTPSDSAAVQFAKVQAKVASLTGEMEALREKNLTLTNQIEETKILFESKEQKLRKEIHLMSAMSAMQYDELETNMQSRIKLLNEQLRDSNSTCSNLRTETCALRKQLEIQKNENRMEEKLRLTEKQLKIAQQKLSELQCNNTCNELPGNFNNRQQKANEIINQYPPLRISYGNEYLEQSCNRNNTGCVADEQSSSFNKIYTTSTNSFRRNESGNRNKLPPLKPLNDTNKSNRIVPKKRKLYNPDDFQHISHLQDLQEKD